VIRRIAGAIDDAQSGINEFIVIEVKTPSKTGNQNKKQY